VPKQDINVSEPQKTTFWDTYKMRLFIFMFEGELVIYVKKSHTHRGHGSFRKT
jgi:hypothetical protein